MVPVLLGQRNMAPVKPLRVGSFRAGGVTYVLFLLALTLVAKVDRRRPPESYHGRNGRFAARPTIFKFILW
jgi:hypothetical protein